MTLADRTPPTLEQFAAYRERFSNWGRWGADDQLGTLNHITPEVRRNAAALIREGRTVSLAHALPAREGPLNRAPAQHYMQFGDGGATDYIGIFYHGLVTTHIDALCHVWTAPDGPMYNGRPASEVTSRGALSLNAEAWTDGIVTRGVLYDIPRLRDAPYVTVEEPVHGWDLDDAARAQGVEPRPGDAVVVRSGFPRFLEETPAPEVRPGLHPSCLEYLYEHDVSLLVWDALEAGGLDYPPGMGSGRAAMSAAIHEIGIAYMGMPLLDNANLERLADMCAELGRWEFHLTVAPLIIRRGTGSPVNPIAMF